ncbi:hypothetical protein EJ08DRAFT_322855 [Tothia fuscella]|uniref:Uncharacterized protein n=1 Tax=Tothia fuscella TaxID=1048955 RepID=A0A9P4NNV7_9PEZI|nr:hypothetical protein EJ08DRAFT_322855 [Tothia fuscella]
MDLGGLSVGATPSLLPFRAVFDWTNSSKVATPKTCLHKLNQEQDVARHRFTHIFRGLSHCQHFQQLFHVLVSFMSSPRLRDYPRFPKSPSYEYSRTQSISFHYRSIICPIFSIRNVVIIEGTRKRGGMTMCNQFWAAIFIRSYCHVSCLALNRDMITQG